LRVEASILVFGAFSLIAEFEVRGCGAFEVLDGARVCGGVVSVLLNVLV